MKLVSYAGQQLVTTDDVAEALVTLAAAVANEGSSEAVQIPILTDGEPDSADLIIGLGNDLLVGPQASDDAEPDFSEAAAKLRSHRLYPKRNAEDEHGDDDADEPWVIDLDIQH